MTATPIIDPNYQKELIGKCYSVCMVMDDEVIKKFSSISGDTNPVHLDEAYAASSRYKKRIAHGLLSASLFSKIFGTKFPGPGCVYADQSLIFKRPVYIDDEVHAFAELISIDAKGQTLEFATRCEVRGRVVIDGNAKVYIPKEKG